MKLTDDRLGKLIETETRQEKTNTRLPEKNWGLQPLVEWMQQINKTGKTA